MYEFAWVGLGILVTLTAVGIYKALSKPDCRHAWGMRGDQKVQMWSKGLVTGTVNKQKRTCTRCGLVQRKEYEW